MAMMSSRRTAASPSYDVVIPCFNRAETVRRAVASILIQDLTPGRIILVDDGSSDATARVIAAMEQASSRIQAVLLPRNGGASAARNAGLALVRSEWVAFLDSDDEWLTGAASAMLQATRDSDVVVGHYQRAWPDGVLDAPECGWHGDDVLAALAVSGAIGPSWSLIRRQTAMDLGGFDPSFHNCNDWDFYVRAAVAGARFTKIPATVAHYHVAAGNRLSLDSVRGNENAARVLAHPGLRSAVARRTNDDLASFDR